MHNAVVVGSAGVAAEVSTEVGAEASTGAGLAVEAFTQVAAGAPT